MTSSIALAVIIPFTFHMEPVPSIVLMVAIYMASEYSGAIPAILANAPGTPAAAPTAFDGYPMRVKGEAGKALTYSILGSGFGSLVGTILLVFTAVWIVKIAIIFGPPEYFALAVLGLSLVHYGIVAQRYPATAGSDRLICALRSVLHVGDHSPQTAGNERDA
jgi:putative tricarboxylic transport membrane protein